MIPAGTVHGPAGTVTNGNFNGPALDASNSVVATIKWELDTAATGQVYVQIWDQQFMSRGLLGVQNVSKGSGEVSLKFSLVCTPGAPVSTAIHTIRFGITRFGNPSPSLPLIYKDHSTRYEFVCRPPVMKAPTIGLAPAGTVHKVP